MILTLQGDAPTITQFCECVRYERRALSRADEETSCVQWPGNDVWFETTLLTAVQNDCRNVRAPKEVQLDGSSMKVFSVMHEDDDADEGIVDGTVETSTNDARVSSAYMAGFRFEDVDIWPMIDRVTAAWLSFSYNHMTEDAMQWIEPNIYNTTYPTTSPTSVLDTTVLVSIEDTPTAERYTSTVGNINERALNSFAYSSFTAAVGEETAYAEVTATGNALINNRKWGEKWRNLNFILDWEAGSPIEIGTVEGGRPVKLVLKLAPLAIPTYVPTTSPSKEPTRTPTALPSHAPTRTPTALPSNAPTRMPTALPSHAPTRMPTAFPSHAPTAFPSAMPTRAPRDEIVCGGFSDFGAELCNDLDQCGWDANVKVGDPKCKECTGDTEDCESSKKACLAGFKERGEERTKEKLALCIIERSFHGDASRCCQRYVCETSGNCPAGMKPQPTPMPTFSCDYEIKSKEELTVDDLKADCSAPSRDCEKQFKKRGNRNPSADELFNCIGDWIMDPQNKPTKCCKQFVCQVDDVYCTEAPVQPEQCDLKSTDCDTERAMCTERMRANGLEFTAEVLAFCIMEMVATEDPNVTSCCSSYVCQATEQDVCAGDNFTYPPTVAPSAQPTAIQYWSYKYYDEEICQKIEDKVTCELSECWYTNKKKCFGGGSKRFVCARGTVFCPNFEGCTFNEETFVCEGTPSVCFAYPNSQEAVNAFTAGECSTPLGN